MLAHSNIVDADLITGSDHNISTLTLDTHLVIRNHAKAKHASNKRKKTRRIYQYNKMDKKNGLSSLKHLIN